MEVNDIIEILKDHSFKVYQHGDVIAYSEFKQVAEIIKERFSSSPIQSKWVSVEERLPEKSQTVLVCTQNGLMDCMWFSSELHWHKIKQGEEIKFWQPLPSPPKQKDKP